MWKVLVLSVVLLAIFQRCNGDYIGAVVEHNVFNSSTPQLIIEENIEQYILQIRRARSQNAKIIVFPEYGLTGLVERPENYSLPVPDVGASNTEIPDYLVLRLSSAALEHQMYVVVNLLEKAHNSDNRIIYYNTNVVFSSNGTIVAKYRKINLFREPNLTPGSEAVTFTTDFGTFGLMTCQDILYHHPSQSMLVNSSVTDVIFSAAWNSYLPFYMSLEVEVGYALANNVNLLASNLNDPVNGRGGSGIYGKDGTILRQILTDSPATNLAIANVRTNTGFSLMGFDIITNETRTELANYKSLRDFDHNSYSFKAVDLSRENITEEICHGSFCCGFTIVTVKDEVNSSEVYKLMAFNGRTQFDTSSVNVKLCNLIACTANDISTCGERPAAPYTTKFRRIVVWGNFENLPNNFYRPATLRGNLNPVYNVTYLESRGNDFIGVNLNITVTTENIVLFGLYGRGGAATVGVSLIFVAVTVVVQCIF